MTDGNETDPARSAAASGQVAAKGPRIRREQKTVGAMLRIYCRAKHGSTDGLCGSCEALRRYAEQRLDICPFAERKPACNRCEVHCYARARREQVREVMRFAGPRMLLRHPLLAVRHLLDERRPVPSLTGRRHD